MSDGARLSEYVRKKFARAKEFARSWVDQTKVFHYPREFLTGKWVWMRRFLTHSKIRSVGEWIFGPFRHIDGITFFTAVLAMVSIFQWRALKSTDDATHTLAQAAMVDAA
jgi:hypothetical protein